MSKIEVTAEVSIDAYDVVEGLNWNMNRLLDFVMEIDGEADNLEFTTELRDRLNKAIEEEQK